MPLPDKKYYKKETIDEYLSHAALVKDKGVYIYLIGAPGPTGPDGIGPVGPTGATGATSFSPLYLHNCFFEIEWQNINPALVGGRSSINYVGHTLIWSSTKKSSYSIEELLSLSQGSVISTISCTLCNSKEEKTNAAIKVLSFLSTKGLFYTTSGNGNPSYTSNVFLCSGIIDNESNLFFYAPDLSRGIEIYRSSGGAMAKTSVGWSEEDSVDNITTNSILQNNQTATTNKVNVSNGTSINTGTTINTGILQPTFSPISLKTNFHDNVRSFQ